MRVKFRVVREGCRKRCGLDVWRGFVGVGWEVEKRREVRGLGDLFVFLGCLGGD